uniref:CDP-diacylglycerol--serine O-phosphatidyltransferase n=2 Tax=Oryza rufipogon TaxID=4529 RepID=A0A0E0MQN4_ORYRU
MRPEDLDSADNKLLRIITMEVNGHHKPRREYNGRECNGVQSVNNFGDIDPWTAWAYKPRTVSLLLMGTCFLIWASGALDPERSFSVDRVSSVKRGVFAMIAVFLAYSFLQAPSTVLIRPHPAIWRLVHGMAVVYLVALTFLLFQTRDDARQFMKYLHPDLGVGIWAGMKTVRYFDGRTYEWVGLSRQPNIISKVKRTLGQFTPAQWDKDEWYPLLGPWRFIQVLSLCIVFMIVELNTFFLKFCLWIPPRNPLIVYRLVLWWLIAIPTIREYNTYLQDRSLSEVDAVMVVHSLDDRGVASDDVPSCVDLENLPNNDKEKAMILLLLCSQFFPPPFNIVV